MSDVIVNKVAESGLISLDLQDYLPQENQLAAFDLKEYLFMGMILKEKDFRSSLLSLDWTPFENKWVALFCSADAIIPNWAYMLVASRLESIAAGIFVGPPEVLTQHLLVKKINALPAEDYMDQRVVIKGCGDQTVSAEAYVAITQKLRPVVKSIMYGEPCSTVPVYKKK
jgi:hypothetical protein